MASTEPIPAEDKAALFDLLKTATRRMEQRKTAEADACMKNNTPGQMTFLRNHDWSGNVKGSYPSPIPQGQERSFVHYGIFPDDTDGSCGVVVYTGTNNQRNVADNCFWLLAWHVPFDGGPNQVLVICGDKNHIPCWHEIKRQLDNSTDESHYYHPETNTKASAVIIKPCAGGPAMLCAVFGIGN